MVAVKKGKIHLRADHLFKLPNGEAYEGVDDDILDVYLFNIEMIPKWSQEKITLLSFGWEFDITELATLSLIGRLIDANETCMYAEIRTRIPETIPRDFNVEDENAAAPQSFAVKSAALKEAIDDLEWPGSSIQITLCPDPLSVMFRGEGHGDLQIDFLYNAQADLFIAFQCTHASSYKYKYKFLKATTANIPAHILKDNRGSKLTISSLGLLKVQHLIPVRLTRAQQHQMDPSTNQQQNRVSYIEFYVMPEEESDPDLR
ncbi:hypothetical protein L7F22_016807 [Adiantum nelumboides]|nr:hypothetical protein [Adiantum nelumboides]